MSDKRRLVTESAEWMVQCAHPQPEPAWKIEMEVKFDLRPTRAKLCGKNLDNVLLLGLG